LCFANRFAVLNDFFYQTGGSTFLSAILPSFIFIKHKTIWHGLPNNTMIIHVPYFASLMVIKF
jgi:hypothetical protein